MMPNLSAACGHCLRAERYKASTPLLAAPPGASAAFECGCSMHGWFTILQQLFVKYLESWLAHSTGHGGQKQKGQGDTKGSPSRKQEVQFSH